MEKHDLLSLAATLGDISGQTEGQTGSPAARGGVGGRREKDSESEAGKGLACLSSQPFLCLPILEPFPAVL